MLRRILRKIYRTLRPRKVSPAREAASTYTPPAPSNEEEAEEEIDLEVDAKRVRVWQEEGKDPLLIDIRQRFEMESGYIVSALLIPMNQLAVQYAKLPQDRPLVLYCAAGARSFGMAHFLREKGYENAWSLEGGIPEWDLGSPGGHPKQGS